MVALVLQRNPTLRAELTRLDAAWATLTEARRPANPQLTVMAPFGPVSAVATLLAPIESLWQLPFRGAQAARDTDVTGEQVVMTALTTVRDARLAHVELGLASDRSVIRRSLAETAAELARVAAVRARVGDVSPLDERLLSAEAKTALDASGAAQTEVRLAQARLATQLALDAFDVKATFAPGPEALPNLSATLPIARSTRPDVRAAELAIAAATARGGWERSRVLAVAASVEGHWSVDGPALRVGGRIELPLFGLNPGGIGRAEAELARATAMHEAVVRNVVLEVTSAHARAMQAERSLLTFEQGVLPALDEALSIARSSFEAGDDSYLVVLDVLRRSGDARLRHADLVAERRRAECELERAIGARLVSAGGER